VTYITESDKGNIYPRYKLLQNTSFPHQCRLNLGVLGGKSHILKRPYKREGEPVAVA
jgi:hypothetical protein